MASILEWNTNYARENNLPIAATFEKLLAIPGGATLFDHQYHINNWEDLAEGLGEQLVAELQSKGQKQFLLDNARKITYAGAGPNDQDFKNFVQTLNTLPLTQTEADKVNIDVQQGVADLKQSQASVAEFERNFKMPGGGFGNLVGDIGKVTKQLAANPVVQIGLAYYMPGIASSLGPYLTAVPAAYQTAVAGALASTAVQTAQGVPFETALKNATVNAITNTGAPKVADYILPYAGSTQVADALTSIGASAAKTAAMGGSKEDIERNMAAALTGSALTSSLQGVNVSRETSRLAGATAGGAVVGGTAGAVGGFASEYGSQKAEADAALERAKKGLASADGTTAFDTGQQLGEVTVTSERDPMLDTSIISPDVSVRGRQPDGTVVVTGKRETTPSLKEVTVIGKREPTTVQDTDITLPVTTVTGKREVDDTLEEVTVKGKREEEPIAEESPVDEQGRYRPSLFIYGGTKPSTLSQSLGTTVERIPTSSTTTGTSVGLGGRGEIESKESGKKRQTVWNEESLRLKDALGL